MTTIDEAVEYIEYIASLLDDSPFGGNDEVCEDYRQVAEWLRELKKLRKDNETFIGALEELHANPVEDELVRVENENDKLRDLVRDMMACINFMDSNDYELEGCKNCRFHFSDDCDFEGRMEQLGIEAK